MLILCHDPTAASTAQVLKSTANQESNYPEFQIEKLKACLYSHGEQCPFNV